MCGYLKEFGKYKVERSGTACTCYKFKRDAEMMGQKNNHVKMA